MCLGNTVILLPLSSRYFYINSLIFCKSPGNHEYSSWLLWQTKTGHHKNSEGRQGKHQVWHACRSTWHLQTLEMKNFTIQLCSKQEFHSRPMPIPLLHFCLTVFIQSNIISQQKKKTTKTKLVPTIHLPPGSQMTVANAENKEPQPFKTITYRRKRESSDKYRHRKSML